MVFEDFGPDVIHRRKMFTPVLGAVHASVGKYKVKLNMDKLIVNSKQNTTTDLEKLPNDINPYVLSTVKKGETTAFLCNSQSCQTTSHHSSNWMELPLPVWNSFTCIKQQSTLKKRQKLNPY